MTDRNNDTDLDLTADPKESPDFLAAPKKGKGVRRLNRVPLFVVGGLVTLAVLGITYTFFERQAQNNAPAKGPEAPQVDTAARPPVRPVGPDYVAPPTPPVETSVPTDTGGQAPAAATQQTAQQPTHSQAYENRMRLIERVEEQRLARYDAALTADAGVQSFRQGKNDGQAAGGQGAAGQPAGGAADPMAQYMAAANMGGPGMGGAGFGGAGFGGGFGEGRGDPNKQAEKRAFLSQRPDATNYLSHTRAPAVSPQQEVKAGTIIPGVLISGVNSDLPGQIIAQVRENVYDSATGQNLLIPAGSRLIGTYDNGVTTGQSRVLVAWTRIIYPDSSSVNLDLMPGADMGGYAGFNDKVNNHYGRIFMHGLLMSMFSAGIQLSMPQKNTGDGYDAQQIMAAELGRQMGQLGMEMARRNMDIQPTLEIRPGYQFNVMVTKDIILPTWQGHPMAKR
ncbi:conjugal transfer protein TrbI [Achromobacter xylosoxidans]|uniref:TrbI/VirB10 family protein n=1 Tax=Alcaligenes xylosoxydans xylosoxydans TaxID=85698 RepID=UPI0015CB4537|nr:TrbI/VirB10 family protein [Achromobacter xylosoxidans]NYS17089.1 conjugal transfer protein TrbI [Achromobacter xylosoxidans]